MTTFAMFWPCGAEIAGYHVFKDRNAVTMRGLSPLR
jgi:hypothetical protein